MMPVIFDAEKDNVAALAALHATAFSAPWDGAAIAQLLAGPGVFVFSMEHGFVMARTVADETEILTLAVRPEARGQGLGRALLEAAAIHAASLGAENIFLEVGADNPAALALYAGLGFARMGQRKGYYDGKDAWMMKSGLPLSQKPKFA